MAHKGIPKLVAPLYCLLLYCTLYNCIHVLKLTCNLAYYSHSSGKCAYYSSIILIKIESLLCLKLCWHNLPGPSVQPLCTESPKYFPQSVLQEKRAGEEKSVWSACQRSGAWSFSTSGGMGPTANVVYKRIASMIAQKHDKTYSKTLH